MKEEPDTGPLDPAAASYGKVKVAIPARAVSAFPVLENERVQEIPVPLSVHVTDVSETCAEVTIELRVPKVVVSVMVSNAVVV